MQCKCSEERERGAKKEGEKSHGGKCERMRVAERSREEREKEMKWGRRRRHLSKSKCVGSTAPGWGGAYLADALEPAHPHQGVMQRTALPSKFREIKVTSKANYSASLLSDLWPRIRDAAAIAAQQQAATAKSGICRYATVAHQVGGENWPKCYFYFITPTR